MLTPSHRTYLTGDLVLDLDRGCLLRAGREVRLRRQTFQVLVFLVERHGHLVGKDDLARAVWPDTFVSDDSLNRCITEIRKALGDTRHQLVKTVPRRGYIFDASVESRGFGSPNTQAADGRLNGRSLGDERATHDALLPFPKHKADNLPEPLTNFIGRERELADVAAILEEHRLLTLIGAGGCGKTRLALEAAGRLRARYRDGVWWTDLAPLTDQRLVAEAVAESIRVRPDGANPMLQRLSEFLSARSVLLVIDNCEHLRVACAELAEAVLRPNAAVRIIATSREALRIQGEYTYPVSGLGLAPAGANQGQILEAEAVRLYVARASVVHPQLALTTGTVRAVSDVCTRLDGVPLAIELAAACGRVLTIEQIASHLNHRFRLLVASDRRLPRHQTLRATIDWSYDQLSEPERRLFQGLSAFHGTWSLEAATAVCTVTREEFDTIELLSGLLDKSLVLNTEDAPEGRRYRMLETMREYALERLRESGEQETILSRHLDYFRTLARSAHVELLGADQTAWLARLRREHDNFRAALAWSAAAPDRITAALELSASLHWFWFMHGHLIESQRWLSSLLARPAPGTGEVRRLTAECHFALGLVTVLLGDSGRGGQHLETALTMARELGVETLAVWTLRMMTHGLVEEGRFAEAQRRAAEAFQTATRLGTPFELSTALGALGIVSRAQCDYAGAAQHFDQSAQHCVSGERWFRAASLADAAEAEERLGDLARAEALAMEGLQLPDDDDTPTIAWSLEVFARARARRGQVLLAARLWGAAEVLRERTGLTLPAYWMEGLAEAIAATRARLGDDSAFTTAWTEGRAMSCAKAIAIARSADVV
jgi:predicted ATPase/DNA-binding winged helix-turn-helix (wHTH) protein